MRVHLTLDINDRVAAFVKRALRKRNLVVGCFVIAVGSAVVYAASVPNTFTTGETLSASKMNANFAALVKSVTDLEAKLAAAPDCPAGYAKDASATTFTLCKRGNDHMVRVADYWIDRYEMSIADGTTWNGGTCDGSGTRYGTGTTSYPAGFPANGNWSTKLYACSNTGADPSRNMTYFQAQQACVLAGKHLCTNGEWQAAVAGTYDPGASNGSTGTCLTMGAAARKTGLAGSTPGGTTSCISHYGAEDMIGNLGEFIDSWETSGFAWMTVATGTKKTPWSASFGSDSTYNVNGTAYSTAGWTEGMPAVPSRGGNYGDQAGSGAFAINHMDGPSYQVAYVGARCCRR